MRFPLMSLALALVAGCSCGHAQHAAAIREGAHLVLEMTSVALVRPLTEAEAATLTSARGTLAAHADALAEDAR